MKKIYRYRTFTLWIILIVIFFALFIITGVLGAVYCDYACFFVAASSGLAACILLVTVFACKLHMPIYYDSTRVKYRDKEINWKDARITAYACLSKSWQYGYFLVFSDRYLIGNDLKNAIKEGFCVYLYFNTLQQLLEYYPYEIKIVEPSDMYNYVRVLKSNKKTNKLFNEHNAKCSEISIDS